MADYFHNITLPLAFSYGSQVGPTADVRVIPMDSGLDKRKKRGPTRLRYELSYDDLEVEDAAKLISFYHCRFGKAYGFKVKDMHDYQAFAEPLQLDGGDIYLAKAAGKRRIILPETAAVSAGSVNMATGQVTGVAYSSGLTWTGTFFVPVRFDSELSVTHTGEDLRTVSFSLMELLRR